MDLMPICGICTKRPLIAFCNKCSVCVCKCCSKSILLEYTVPNKSYIICQYCTNVCGDLNIFNKYIYCYTCEDFIPREEEYKLCGKCNESTAKPSRALLPHCNAKPIIEKQFIPEIAAIIFDYYYKPRRYYHSEF